MAEAKAAKVLPVIDLLHGQVVRGVAGERDKYQPVKSVLCHSPDPADVAAAFHAQGARECYVADLDAIIHNSLSQQAIQAVVNAGLRVWLDAGLNELPRWPPAFQRQLGSAVLGSETVSDLTWLQRQVDFWGELAVVSLDLKHGELLGNWRGLEPLELASAAYRAGCRRFIALDLAAVGSDQGLATLTLCDRLRDRFDDIELTTGGGVRNQADLDQFAAHGCDYVLVASALHNGAVKMSDCGRAWD